MRKTLSSTHFGPESLEDAAVDYIVRNLDLYDVQDSVNVSSCVMYLLSEQLNFDTGSGHWQNISPPQGVINAMNVNPRISFPPEVDFALISALIREMCRVAFAMQTLEPSLDLAFATDSELYNDNKSVHCSML